MKNMNMNTPLTRAEFERNLHLLHRQMKDGKFHVAQGLARTLDGIARVRFLPNGRIDLLSVDESARLQANMMNQFDKESFQELLKENQTSSDALEGARNEGDPPNSSLTGNLDKPPI
jgi:hypothetical protein